MPQNGTLPDQGRDTPTFGAAIFRAGRGFDFANSTLESKVEPVLADFTTVDLAPSATFDVVLYLGVLYHMKEPLTCLERVRAGTQRSP